MSQRKYTEALHQQLYRPQICRPILLYQWCPSFKYQVLTLIMLYLVRKNMYKTYTCIFYHFSKKKWNSAGSWNPALWKTMIGLSCILNTITADALATYQGVSSHGVSTSFSWRLVYVLKDMCLVNKQMQSNSSPWRLEYSSFSTEGLKIFAFG